MEGVTNLIEFIKKKLGMSGDESGDTL